MNPPVPTPPMGSIPSNISEATFRLYEPHITLAVNRWPEETEFPATTFLSAEGKTISGNTFTARFRDALISLKRFSWTTTIDVTKLWSITGKFVISLDWQGGSVWFRNKARRGAPLNYTAEARSKGFAIDADITRIPWSTPTEEEIRAVCILLNGQRITGPIILEGLLAEVFAKECEAAYPVFFTWDHPNNKTIITT